ncbi:DUF2306 domain-containing protein [Roseiconus nitratireducens]|uniref:DUF2306 domain-containing protein n=1 Tax=Roseiconus nitratireducens TaxID=2605748 RepID=UPI00137584C7|nr:DUF2306 domain-containing protein [Roseiconus nitratireducens]
MHYSTENDRYHRLRQVALWSGIVVSIKVFLGILYEYQWYFPADFTESAFLGGRRYSFSGLYRVAFYAHVVSCPIALLLGTALVVLGRGRVHIVLHRRLGKVFVGIVILAVVPSGLVMASQAYAGPWAAAGFVALSLATGATALAAAATAIAGRLASHRVWAMRCFILMWSPLLLRMISGLAIVTGWESETIYQWNAWISWLVPLGVHQVVLVRSARWPHHEPGATGGPITNPLPSLSGAES